MNAATNGIPGWYYPPANEVLLACDAYHKANNLNGHLGEIGVYHGRSAIPLAVLAGPDEIFLAVDCFENQKVNRDQSGQATRQSAFEATYKRWIGSTENLRVLSGDSQVMTTETYLQAAGGPFRIFSIDGCHTESATRHDLEAVSEAMIQGGFITVDDYTHPSYPGVKPAVDKFLAAHPEWRIFDKRCRLVLSNAHYEIPAEPPHA